MRLARNPWVVGAAGVLAGAAASLLVSRLVFGRDSWEVSVIPLLVGSTLGFLSARQRTGTDGR